MAERQRFRTPIYKVGMNYCVDVPTEASRLLGGETHVSVAGEVAGVGFWTRLTPRGGGAYRLFLNGAVRAPAAGAGVGDVVTVELWREEGSRERELPDDLAAALGLDRGLEAFAALSEAQRMGMIEFVRRARTAGTRAKYVERVVDEVRGRIGRG